jgi:asparagine synthetase B (glutamine-hydrolysing)
MNPGSNVQLSRAFTIFGFTKDSEATCRKLDERLGIVPKTIDFGNAGHFFLFAPYGDVAETRQALALKLGFVRLPDRSPLSARQLLDQKIITPWQIDPCAIRGCSLLACFSKTEPRFVAFESLASETDLYYWAVGGELMGSNNLAYVVTMLDQVELNEDTLPFHFLFQHAPAPLTYYKNIRRLEVGHIIKWQAGTYDISQVQDCRFRDHDMRFGCATPQSVALLFQELSDTVGAYIGEIEASGHSFGNLLSGGVDSSILQLIINERAASKPARSFSFAPLQAPSFEFEIGYARIASTLLGSDHTFVNFGPEEYAGLIPRAIEILGQPVLSDVEPGKLALAEFLGRHVPDLHFFFVGSGADTLFGLGLDQKLKVLEFVGKIPGSRFMLAGAGRLLKPYTVRGETMVKGADILSHANDPHLFVAPVNSVVVFSNLDVARRCFGDETLRNALEYRRNLEIQYLNSANYAEKVHLIELLTTVHETHVQSAQLFLVNHKRQVYPYVDDDIIRLSLAFRPEIRYIKGLRTKPFLKDILERRGLSAIARKPKGASIFTDDVSAWMRSGPLREMVRDINRPGFLSQADFERLLEEPDYFLWNLLTFDIFQKKFLICSSIRRPLQQHV